MTIGRFVIMAATWVGVSGCALLGKSEPMAPRYFSPSEADAKMPELASTSHEPGVGAELRVGRITAASYLAERIVFRESNYELKFYEDRRWTERPEVYLRRALSRALFEEQGLHRVVSGPALTLDVELTEFSELKSRAPLAQVRATYILYDNRLVRREGTVEVVLPIATDDQKLVSPEAAVQVMTTALRTTVRQIVMQVIAELAARAPG